MAFLRVEMVVEEFPVVLLDVSGSGKFQHVIAVIHQHAKTLQSLHDFLNIGNDWLVLILLKCRHIVLGNRSIDTELYLLRVDKYYL